MPDYKYKNYIGRAEPQEDGVLYGRVLGIVGTITFVGPPQLIEQEFHTSVDEYLDFCGYLEVDPEKPTFFEFGGNVIPAEPIMVGDSPCWQAFDGTTTHLFPRAVDADIT
jgi:hypothetical protein